MKADFTGLKGIFRVLFITAATFMLFGSISFFAPGAVYAATNVVLNKPAVSLPSQSVLPFTPARAVDGIVNTNYSRWYSAEGGSSQQRGIQVDLQGAYEIYHWTVYHLSPSEGYDNSCITSSFNLQGSVNGTDWFTIDTVAGNTSVITSRDFSNCFVRYVRLMITKGTQSNNNWASIEEFEVLGNPTTVSSAAITGTPQVGSSLTASVTPGDATVSYQWKERDSQSNTYTDITGAASGTYTPDAANIGHYIEVVATGTGIFSGKATSTEVGPVTAALTSTAISGTAQVNSPLTASVTPAGATVGYQWQKCSTPSGTYIPINNATSITYTPVASDAGNYIEVVATGTGNYTGFVTSPPTDEVAADNTPLSLNTTGTSLPDGTVGSSYNSAAITTYVSASGGTAPYSYDVSGLPSGLSFDSSTNEISGTPSASFSGTVSASVTDSVYASASINLPLTIASIPPPPPPGLSLTATGTSLPDGTVGSPYNSSAITTYVSASGGTAPYSYDVSGLPSGLSFDSSTNEISGTPSASFSGTVSASVTDSVYASASINLPLTIASIQPPPPPGLSLTATGTSLPDGAVGSSYNSSAITTYVSAIGGTAPYSYNVTGLPTGLSFDSSTNEISGTPSASFSGTVSASVTDSVYDSASINLPLTVNSSGGGGGGGGGGGLALNATGTGLPAGTVGSPYNSVAITTYVSASGGTAPYSYGVSGLPSGLSFDSSTNEISGTPSTSFSGNVSASVTDSVYASASINLPLTIASIPPPPPPGLSLTATGTSLPGGTVGSPYNSSAITTYVSASGGTAPYSYDVSGLSSGLSFDSSTNEISGTPSASFSGNVSVTVNDSDSGSAGTTLPLTIDSAGGGSGGGGGGGSTISAPTVITDAATSLTSTSAVLNGKISSRGGDTISAYGFSYSTDEKQWTQVPVGSDNLLGSFSYPLTGLTRNTAYYFKAYATNGQGVTYGAEKSFIILQQTNPLAPNQQIVLRFYIGSKDYYVNDKQQTMDISPTIINDRTMLPLRYVGEPLGAAVSWDGDQHMATIAFNGKTIKLWLNQSNAMVNDTTIPIDASNHNVTPIILPPGRVVVPVRFIAEQLGCTVDWNPSTQEVKLTYPGSINKPGA